MQESAGILLPGSRQAPPEDLNLQEFRLELPEPHYAATAYSPAKLSFAVTKWPDNDGPARAKAILFTRPSMLVGPIPSADNAGENGGAAGNRTRVRSAYYKRLYRHSPGEPGLSQYRGEGMKNQ